MEITIGAIGRAKSGPETALVDDYLTRARGLGGSLGIKGPVLKVGEAPKALSGAERQRREAQILCEFIPKNSRLILLDEGGKDLPSVEFSKKIGRWRDDGERAAVFLIGGADGFCPDFVRAHQVEKIAFGRATWPHMMVRAMLAEQIYRSFTLLSGHPYHRA